MSQESTPVFVNQTKKYARRVGDRNYVTAAHPSEDPLFKRFIDERVYAEALSGLAIECVDMLIYNPRNESFLIGTRQQEPQAGDWVIGGRMRAGESVQKAAIRNAKRELGLNIDPNKLRTVGHYNIVWDTREQPPVAVMDDEANPRKIIGHSTGAHNTSTLELYPLSFEEVAQLEHNEEYSSLRWIKPEEILNAPEGDYHPCLVDMVRDGLDTVTTPEPPRDIAEQRVRLEGSIAIAQTALRKLGQ